MSAASTHERCTVLEIGARGKHRGAAFELAGRSCVRSTTGGLWNEWTVAFDDGRRAFLAEALGAFTLFFERPMAPPFESLAVGKALANDFVVVERGEGKRVATWGTVPDAPRTYRYADLSSPSGESATIDYGSGASATPDVFVGRRVRLSEIGLAPRAEPPRFLPAPVGPHPKGLALFLDVGDEGNLASGRFRIIGVVRRSIRIEGERYTWEEYVLHSATEGLRWLVVADGHWNLVESVEAGLVTEDAEKSATFRGVSHRFYSSGKARVDWATGELPWEVAIGDQTDACDYLRAPHMLSRESSADEVTWSYGTYTPPDVVARAFDKRVLPRPSGRAPNQPKQSNKRR